MVGGLNHRPKPVMASSLSVVPPRVEAVPLFEVRRGKLHWFRSYVQLARYTQIEADQFYYFFIPGNVSLVMAVKAIRAGVPFGVYLRGQLPSVGWQAFLYRRIVASAQFALCTGGHLKADVEGLGTPAEEVAPMLKTCGLGASAVSRSDGKPLRILFVGNVLKEKGVMELVDACRRCRGVIGELSIVGPCLDQALHAAICSDAEKINIMGAIADPEKLAALYRDHDVLVLPSYSEGFPRVVYEAMSYGLAVVATPCCGIKFAFEDEKQCLFVPFKDSRAISSAILRLHHDRLLLTEIARSGRRWVEEKFAEIGGLTHAQQFLHALSRERA